jgi:hypothetical protein
LLRAAILCGIIAAFSLVLPIVERSQVESVATERTRQLLNGAAWRWQGLVAAGTPPGEATEMLSEALHARIVSAGADPVDIPFLPRSNVAALHDSFRLNPFIRSALPRTIDAIEQRELRESATRVAVLATALHKHELERAGSVAQQHLAWGLLLSVVAAGAATLLIRRWKQRGEIPISRAGTQSSSVAQIA